MEVLNFAKKNKRLVASYDMQLSQYSFHFLIPGSHAKKRNIYQEINGMDKLASPPCSGKGEIIDWFCCVSNLQPSDYTQI